MPKREAVLETYRYYYTLHLYQSTLKKNLAIILAVAFTIFMIFQRLAFALPSGYSADSGEVTFEQVTDKTLNINASHNSIIHYNSFSIAADETVNFSLPAIDSFSLNRVLGSETTQIYGKLNANGNLILVNSNGFYIGPQAHITTGGLIASTHDISNANFLAGRYIFAGMGNSVSLSKSFIRNDGHIEARAGGMAVLVGDAVENRGVIEAPLGMVALAAGNVVTVGISYDGLVSVGIDEPTAHTILDMNGNPITDQIKNSGALNANGGQVLMNAQAVHHVFANSMNLSGMARANTAQVGKDGVVEIVSSGSMKVEGTYEAAGGKVDFESGTSIGVTGETVTKGDTTLKSKEDIVVNANVTTDSGTLIFHADSDLNGSGAFLQAAGTTIKTTTFGDIKIYSSGESTLGNLISAGGVYLYQAGASVKYTQHPGSLVVAGDFIHINEGVSLKASDTVYEVAKDWLNHGTFIPDVSIVKLVGPEDATVYGDNTFNDFVVIEPEKSVSFEAGSTQEILGVLTLKGEFGKLLVLRSTQASMPWKIDPKNMTDIVYVDMKDASNIHNHGPPVEALYSKNSLGNSGFSFSDVVFTGVVSPQWSNPLNWDGGFVPGESDAVKFSSSSPDSLVDVSSVVSALYLDSSYLGTVTLGSDLTVKGDVTLAGGILAGGSYTLTVGGSWSAVGGHFDAETSTVVFNDASKASYIYGGNTFYNFTSLTPTKVLYFEKGKTQTILGMWKLQGAYAQHVWLLSSEDGVQWMVDPRGAVEISYTAVKDSVNLVPYEIVMVESSNRGNSVGWDPTGFWFGIADADWDTASSWTGLGGLTPGAGDDVVFQGTVASVSENTASDLDTAFTVGSVSMNSGYTAMFEIFSTGSLMVTNSSGGTGNFTIAGSSTVAAATGATVSITITGNFSQTGGLFGNSSVSPVLLKFTGDLTHTLSFTAGTFAARIILDNSGETVNLATNFTINANGLLDIQSTAGTSSFNTGAFIFTNSGAFTQAAGTFNGGSNTNDFNSTWALSGGTYTASSASTLVASTFTVSGTPTFNNSSGTFTFDTSAATLTPTGITFNHVTLSSSSIVKTLASTLTINGNLTIANSTSVLSLNGNTLTLAVSSVFSNFGILRLLGSETITNLTTNDIDTGTWEYVGTVGPYTIRDFGTQDYFNLTIAGGAAVTFNLGANLDANGSIVLTTGILDVTASNFSINVGANWTDAGTGSFTERAGTVTFDGTAVGTISSNEAFNHVVIGGTGVKTLGAALLVNSAATSNLTISAGSTLALASFGLTLGASSVFSNEGTLRLFGAETLTNFVQDTNSGTFYYNSGAASTITVKDFGAGVDYFDLQIVGGASTTYSLGAPLNVDGSVTITSGIFDVSVSNFSINVGGGWTDTGSGTFTERTGTVTFDGTGTLDANETFFNVDVNTAGTVALGSTFTTANLTLTAGTFNAGSSNSNISGNWTDTGGGTFTEGTTTVTFTGTGTINANEPFFNVTINTAGTVTLGAALDVDGSVVLTAGTFSNGGGALGITVAGNWTDTGAGVFNEGTGTVTFDGTAVGTISSNEAFNHVVIGGTGVKTLGAALLVNSAATSNLTISAGSTLALASFGLTLGASSVFSNDGTLRLFGTETLTNFVQDTNSGTFYYNGTASAYTVKDFSAGADYFDLQIVGGASTTYSLGADLNVNGMLTMTSGNLLADASARNITLLGNFAMNSAGTFGNANTSVLFAGDTTHSLTRTNGTISAQFKLDNSGETVSLGSNFVISSTGSLQLQAAAGTSSFNTGSFTFQITGPFTQAAGIFNGGSNTNDFDGTWTLSGGTYTASSGGTTVATTFSASGSPTFNHNSGTVTIDGNSIVDINFGGITLNNLTFSPGSGWTKTITGNVTVNGTLTAANPGNIIADATPRTITLVGNFSQTAAGTAIFGSTNLFLAFAGDTTHTLSKAGAGSFQAKVLIDNSGETVNLATNFVITTPGYLTFNSLAGTSSFNTGGFTFQLTGVYDQSAGTFNGGSTTNDFDGTVTFSGGTHTASSGSTTYGSSVTFSNIGAGATFNHNSGTVTVDGNSIVNINFGGATFNNLTFSPGSGWTKTITGDMTVNGTLTAANPGNIVADGTTRTITLVGNFSQTAAGTNAFGSANLFLSFGGGNAQTIATAGSANTLAFQMVVNKSGNSVTLSDGLEITSTGRLEAQAGTLDLASFDFNLNSTANGPTIYSFLQSGGSVTGTGRLLVSGGFKQTGGSITAPVEIDTGSFGDLSQSGGATVTNLTFTHGGGWTKTFISDFTVLGNLSITVASSIVVSDATGRTIMLSGNFSQSGTSSTFGNSNSLTLKFTGTAAQTFSQSAGASTIHIIEDKSSDTLTLNSNLTVASGRNFTITNGIFVLNGFTWTMAGSNIFSNNGTVRMRGTATETITGLTQDTDSGTFEIVGDADGVADPTLILPEFGATDFYNLLVISTDTGASADTFQSGAAKVIAGTLTVTSGTYDAVSFATTVTGLATVNGGTYSAGTGKSTFNGGLTLSSGTFSAASATSSAVTYTVTSISQGQTSLSGSFNGPTGDEGMVTGAALGFTFTFFGTNYTTVNISSNGWISFTDTTNNFTPQVIPTNSGSPNTVVAGWWVDLNPSSNIRYESTGSPGSKVFVVSYEAVNHWSTGANPVTMQIKLYETSNTIETHCSSCDTNTGNHVQGIENQGGTAGYYFGTRGNPGLTTALTNDAVRFAPDPAAGVVIVGNYTQSGGTATFPSGTATVSGNFSHTAGTLNHSNGTVQMNGTNQTISGSTTFYSFTKQVTSAATLTFTAGTTQTFAAGGTLTLEGTSGNLLSLRSSSTPTQWNIDPLGTRVINYVDVQDSNNPGTTIPAGTGSVNSGNNVGWSFGISLAGIVYTDEGVTNIGSGKTIAVSKNGAAASTGATNGSGAYTVTVSTLASGDILLFYIDGAAEDGVTVTISDGLVLTGYDIYQNRLIVRYETGTQITNANLDTAHNGDADVTAIYTDPAGSGNLTVAAGKELFISSGKTFAPGGTVTVEDVDINGTFTMAANTVNVSGNWDATGGTFTSAGTVSFTATSSKTIRSNGSSFSSANFNGSGGVWTLQDAMDANSNVTLTAGTLDVSGSNFGITVGGSWTDTGAGAFTEQSGTVTFDGTGTLNSNEPFNNVTINTAGTVTLGAAADINGNLVLTAGTLDVSASNFGINVAGSWTDTGAGTFLERSGTVTFDGTGTLNSNEPFNNVTINTAGTVTLGAAADINGNLVLTAGTLDVSASNYQINLAGNWTKTSGSFTPQSGTVVLDGTSQTISGSNSFFNLTKTVAAAATLTFTASTTQTVTGTLTLQGASGQLLSLRSSATPTRWNIDPQGSRSISFVDVMDSNNTNATAIAAPSNSTNSGNNLNWQFAVLRTWTGTTSTDWAIATNWSGGVAPFSYDDVVIADVANDPVLDTARSMTNLTINANGILSLNGNGLTVSGTFINNGTLELRGDEAVSLTPDIDSGTFSYRGRNIAETINIKEFGGTDYFNLLINDINTNKATFSTAASTVTVAGATTVSSGTLLVAGSSLVTGSLAINTPGSGVMAASGLLRLTGTGTPLSGTGTLDTQTNTPNTIEYAGSGAQTLVTSGVLTSYSNLVIASSNTVSPSSGTVTATGTLMVTSGTLNMNGRPGTFTGLATVNGGTYTASSALQTMNGGLTVSSGAFTGGAGNVDINGNMGLSGGTFTASSNSTFLSSDMNYTAGTFNHNSGTFALDSSTWALINVPGSITFNNLTFNAATGVKKRIGNADVWFVLGNLNFTFGVFDREVTPPGPGRIDVSGNVTVASTWGGDPVRGGGNARLNFVGGAVQDFNLSGGGEDKWDGRLGIGKSAGEVRLQSDLTLNGLGQIMDIFTSTSVFNLNGFNLNINPVFIVNPYPASGVFVNIGTVKLKGSETVFILATNYNPMAGIWEYLGNANSLSTTFTLKDFGTYDYFNLIINSTDAGANADTFELGANLKVSGALTITSGILSAGPLTTSTFQINMAGNWTNSVGTTGFLPRQGTVVLDGGSQSITGSNNWYNLTKTTSVAATLTFQASQTQTVTGTLTLQGGGTAGTRLSLRSSSPATPWLLNSSGPRSLSWLDVQDSNASGSASALVCLAGTCLNSGGNTNWTIA